jgi:hypothetical protein
MDIIGSAGTKDSIIATTANDNAAVKSMTGVENLTLNVAGGDSAFDFSKATGLTKVTLDDDDTARAITLTDLETGTGVTINTGVTATNVVVDLADKATAGNSVTLTTATTVDTVDIDVDNVETVVINNTTGASTVDLAGMAMTTAGATNVLSVTGNQVLTVSALNADVTTINASGSTGGVIVSATSVTAASTITGSAAADTFIMSNAADAINSGEGADTLVVKFTSVLGGVSVDLSATDDQISTFNGAANAAVQVGFVNVNLAAYNGNGGQITANVAGSFITGSSSVDSIALGAGADIVFSANGQFATADNVQGFTVLGAAADKLQFVGALIGDANTTATFTAAAAINAGGNSEINVITTALADDAAIITAIQTSTDATGQMYVVFNTADAETQVWYDLNPNVDGAETQILTLAGISDAAMDGLVTGNFILV